MIITEEHNKWISAQIEQLQARTDALNQNDGLININHEGLQPQLEAFMLELLKTMQARMGGEIAND